MEPRQMKTCPYCGKEILDGAKKCRYCKTWLASECPICGENVEPNTTVCPHCSENILSYKQSLKDKKMISTLHKTYTTHRLSGWDILFRFYYVLAQPSCVRLETLTIEGDMITVEKRNGHTFKAPISEMFFRTEMSNFDDYYYIKMMHQNVMTRIIRVNETLSKEEWDGIVAHLRKYAHELPQHGGKVSKILIEIIEWIK